MTRLTPLFLAALVMLSSPALPNDGQITLVVGFSAGGTSSTAARIVAEAAEQITRTSTIVENRPGAGGAIAADWVLRQKGTQTLLFMSSTSSLRTSPQSGLVPIGILATFPYVAVSRKDAPAHLAEYMQEASREEKYRTVATAGAGSIPHLIGTKLFDDYGVPMVHVPYQGSAPAILSVLGGHVAVAIVPFPDFLPFQDSLRILAQTGSGIETEGWVGIFAPPETSAEEVARLSEIFRQASQRSQEKLQNVGFKHVWRSGAEARAIHEKDYTEWTPILKVLGIQP
ncbi:tripartite tricarboxylate transporter substrate binding protein [Bradyrhizobium sp. KBS0727]|uniref:Bug family tripartite tricarboxylate transporter substrate binding protein n=1 Tax=unclassified Bradyrhizobium TaxID=2631580 RepID=UPI00110DC393|nr:MULTISPECIES: tripartite tricarboxylate transporter substrate binding protein [unclassified Bradyrhizobium]QDW36651.1 tripartite tricarboxylate transporter substrate binding protein [Bradyrhizobium sp. KBS0725]QDW43252.1 tripartite tricarboxylate transporter substrate binding protein [Bradyrhizobium sp. KBS0727]